jgi:hypothetical protein
LDAVDNAFNLNIDYAQLVKMYGAPEGTAKQEENIAGTNVQARRKILFQVTKCKIYFYQLRRTPKPDNENEHEAFYPSY